MMRSLLSGKDYLDILVIGDSNAGYSGDVTGARGYSGGFFDSLYSASGFNIKEYATGLAEPGTSALTYIFNGSTGETYTSFAGTIQTIDTGSNTNSHVLRSSLSDTEFDGIWYQGTPVFKLKVASVAKDISILRTTTANSTYNTAVMALNYNTTEDLYTNALSCRDAASFEVYYAVGANQSSLLRGWVYKDADSSTLAGNNSGQTAPVSETPFLKKLTYSWAADASRGKIKALYDMGSSRGKIAVLWRSYFRTGVPGASITQLQCASGDTTLTIANSFSDSVGCRKSTIKTYLQYLVDRQKTCGGSGNIMVFVNMGTNDAGASIAPQAYTDNASSIINQFTAAWNDLGYPASKLAFVLTVSHAWTFYDPSTTYAIAAGAFKSNPAVTCYDINAAFPASYLSSQAYYTSGSGTGSSVQDAHLARVGYRAISTAIINALKAS